MNTSVTLKIALNGIIYIYNNIAIILQIHCSSYIV